MKHLSPSAMCEIRRLKGEIDTILAKPNCTRADGKRVDAMLGQISAIKEAGITDLDAVRARVDEIGASISAEQRRAVEAHEHIFRSFMTGAKDDDIKSQIEQRGTDLLAGQQAISFTAGSQGGFLVPESFRKNIELGMAQADPLLDSNVATVVHEPSLVLKPLQLPGWDLSTISASRVSEATQHTADAVPQVNQDLLNAYSYRLSIGASMEFEQDVFDSAMARLGEAFGVGFARGIGKDLVNGSGISEPQGIFVGATNSGVGSLNNPLRPVDLTNVYFSVNRIYRANPKCAWLMADQTYRNVRQMVDTNGRPVINMVGDQEMILGKPVYITPSLHSGVASASVGGGVVIFGDLSHYVVHVSSMHLRRNLQTPGYIEYGKALYTGYMRADAVVNDPTNGAMPPIVYAPVSA
jgi:HK97 family phage major capsid protein